LGDFGVTGYLVDPKISLVRLNADGTTTTIATKDDWSTGGQAAQIANAASAVGAFSLVSGSKDAALIANVETGLYTIVVEGVSGGTGTALAEVYSLE